ncbi:MAG: glutaredoxin 3 [Cyanobium sp.]
MIPRQPASAVLPVAKVDIYTNRFCPLCLQAKGVLDRKGVAYSEYIIDHDDESREVMLRRAEGRSSVPQIFINGRAIGGLEELEALDAAGQLDVLLGERPQKPGSRKASSAKTPPQADSEPTTSGTIRGLFQRFTRS